MHLYGYIHRVKEILINFVCTNLIINFRVDKKEHILQDIWRKDIQKDGETK